MKLFNIELDEFGQVICTDEHGNSLFLQMPVTPDSQNTINDEPLYDTYEYTKALDEYFGKGIEPLHAYVTQVGRCTKVIPLMVILTLRITVMNL